MPDEPVIDLYERHAREFDRDRGRALQEKAWLDRFLELVPSSGTILDLGCGMAEPIAKYFIQSGREVVGLDSSRSMVELCRGRFPQSEWRVADMRQLELGRRFDGIVAWDSFFHLNMADQRGMFPRFAAHARTGAPLLFTCGPVEGEAIGSCGGEPLYHSSLRPAEYERLLHANGFSVRAYLADDPECGGHTVWLATYDGDSSTRGSGPQDV
jgi:predicted TPR repeat methyltransferase